MSSILLIVEKKQCVCHINMLKQYFDRDVKPTLVTQKVSSWEEEKEVTQDLSWPGSNSEVLGNLDQKLKHLDPVQRKELSDLILSFPSIFKDSPGRTNLLYHDVEVGNNKPIKQYPYRINPTKGKIITDEVDYMLTNNLIKPSFSPWSSPVVLVPKPNNQFHLCLDYRKVNAITKTDSYPLPRVDDCVDRIGNAQFISKFDLLKGYWQVPLTERAKEISAFITHNGLYQCNVMPFGMKNTASTFQRLMNIVCSKVKNCVVYIDDLVIYSNSWEDHLQSIRELFKAIQNANLVINLAKSDFSQAKITYLGFEVGYGKVLPKESNIQAILDFPVPKTRKNIRQFIGLAGYYRKFVLNFSRSLFPNKFIKEKCQF